MECATECVTGAYAQAREWMRQNLVQPANASALCQEERAEELEEKLEAVCLAGLEEKLQEVSDDAMNQRQRADLAEAKLADLAERFLRPNGLQDAHISISRSLEGAITAATQLTTPRQEELPSHLSVSPAQPTDEVATPIATTVQQTEDFSEKAQYLAARLAIAEAARQKAEHAEALAEQRRLEAEEKCEEAERKVSELQRQTTEAVELHQQTTEELRARLLAKTAELQAQADHISGMEKEKEEGVPPEKLAEAEGHAQALEKKYSEALEKWELTRAEEHAKFLEQQEAQRECLEKQMRAEQRALELEKHAKDLLAACEAASSEASRALQDEAARADKTEVERNEALSKVETLERRLSAGAAELKAQEMKVEELAHNLDQASQEIARQLEHQASGVASTDNTDTQALIERATVAERSAEHLQIKMQELMDQALEHEGAIQELHQRAALSASQAAQLLEVQLLCEELKRQKAEAEARLSTLREEADKRMTSLQEAERRIASMETALAEAKTSGAMRGCLRTSEEGDTSVAARKGKVAVLVEAIEEGKSPIQEKSDDLENELESRKLPKSDTTRRLNMATNLENFERATRGTGGISGGGRLSLSEQGVLQQRLAASEARTRAAEQRWQQAQEEVAAVKENVGKELNRLTEACQALKLEAAARLVDQQTIERLRGEVERLSQTQQQQQAQRLAQQSSTRSLVVEGLHSMPSPERSLNRQIVAPGAATLQACAPFTTGTSVSIVRQLSPRNVQAATMNSGGQGPVLARNDANLSSGSFPGSLGGTSTSVYLHAVGSSPVGATTAVDLTPGSPVPAFRFRSPRLTAPESSPRVATPGGLPQYFS